MTRLRYSLCVFALLYTGAVAAEATAPTPALTPREVVAAQLAALREDTPASLARAFTFASPANQDVTGPITRFTAMLREGYPDLLRHRSVRYEEALVAGNAAAQTVEIIDADGLPHRYVFMLSRQRGGPCPGCWMTDGVVDAPAADGVAI